MQYRAKEYDEALHERWRALSIGRMLAEDFTTPVVQSGTGEWLAVSRVLCLPFGTSHRGPVLFCTAEETVGVAELWDVERVGTEYRWHFRHPRRVVPYPVAGARSGLWWYVCPRGEVTPYPMTVRLGDSGLDMLKGRKQKK